MAQHKQLTWTELRVGLFVLAGAVLLAVVIFYVTGGSGFGPKYRLRAFLPEVDGLTVGAPVRVDGVDVGNVEKIAIAVPKPGEPASKDRNIEVDLRLQKTFKRTSARTPPRDSLPRDCSATAMWTSTADMSGASWRTMTKYPAGKRRP